MFSASQSKGGIWSSYYHDGIGSAFTTWIQETQGGGVLQR